MADKRETPDKTVGQLHLRKNIFQVAVAVLSALILLFVYVSYVQVWHGSFLAGHPLNRRGSDAARKFAAGSILDRNGEPLAFSEPDAAGGFRRQYPYGAVLAHIIGYSSPVYGQTGLEASAQRFLTGMDNPGQYLGPVKQLLRPTAGNSVKLTIDLKLQQLAFTALGNHRGAIIVISPQTGAILAAVSKPGFDPNQIDQQWNTIAQDPDSPLLNRVTQGLYPPGSSIKPLVADAALTDHIVTLDTHFDCEGSLQISPDYTLSESEHQAYGNINLQQALTVSSNVAFGTIAMQMGPQRLAVAFDRYGFSRAWMGELQESSCHLPKFDQLNNKGDIAQIGIGQGSLLVTPLHMAMMTAAIANKGTIMKPYLIDQIIGPNGAVLQQTAPEVWLQATSSQLADTLSSMMTTVVTDGTGRSAAISGIQVAGKTGTAENPHGQPHAWFIGFAPAKNPQIAVVVVVENAGFGGETAAPIARQLFLQALR